MQQMPRNDRHLDTKGNMDPSKQDAPAVPVSVGSIPDDPGGTKMEKSKRQDKTSKPRVPRLLLRYREDTVPKMMDEFSFSVPLQVPRLEKVVLNVGLGEAIQTPNSLDAVTQMLSAISGQQPVITKARRSIAGFKLREGMRIGVMVTLRSHRMYDFVDRLLNAALPRIRDFRGVPRNSFDGNGNYSLGIREQVIFPEIEYSRIDKIRSLQVSFVTSANSDLEGFRLLELMGMPFAHTQN